MNTSSSSSETEQTSSAIEQGIQRTRDRMDATINELGNRLSPKSLVNSLVEWWEKKEAGPDAQAKIKSGYRIITRHVKENPVPSLLIGAGITWLLLNSDDEDSGGRPRPLTGFNPDAVGSDEEGGSPVANVVGRLKDKVTEAKEGLSDLADAAREKAGTLAESLGSMTDSSTDLLQGGKAAAQKAGQTIHSGYDAAFKRLRGSVEAYPLAVGAGFLALGALVGVLVPSTRKEDEIMGEKSDAVIDAAKEKGEELLEKGKEAAEKVGEKVADEAGKLDLNPENAGSKLSELTGTAGEILRNAASQIGEAVKTDSKPE